jgi:hypothetical protein
LWCARIRSATLVHLEMEFLIEAMFGNTGKLDAATGQVKDLKFE